MDFFRINRPSPATNQKQEEKSTNLVVNCRWSVNSAPPATPVRIIVESTKEIDAETAQVSIFQEFGGRENPIAVLTVPFTGKKNIDFEWKTQAAKGGKFEEGVYHFRVMVGNHQGRTPKANGLQLKDIIEREKSSYTPGINKKPPVNISGY
ncbi:MAG TPA: hypothetical protein VGC97_05495 [Pyrinomonadaceae bacterium]|jgi:hypothetical protein